MERTRNHYMKYTKGHYYIKTGSMKILFFFSAHILMMLYICTKFHEETLKDFKVKSQHETLPFEL